MPFYYNFLEDPCVEIRNLALNLVMEFCSYAELVLIEGMTRGSINCKLQCAKGLGLRGVHNFRALLLGMRDINEKVRRECCSSILQNYNLYDIVPQYKGKVEPMRVVDLQHQGSFGRKQFSNSVPGNENLFEVMIERLAVEYDFPLDSQ